MKIRTRCNDCNNIVVETAETTLEDIRANWDNFVVNVAPAHRCKVCNNLSPSSIFNINFFIVDDDGVEHPVTDYIRSKIDIDAEVERLSKMSGTKAESILRGEPIDVDAVDITEEGGEL